MDTAPGSCVKCDYSAYPAFYSPTRRQAAVAAAFGTLANLVLGLALFWARRRSHIVAQREQWNTVAMSLCTLLLMEIPAREYWGEGAMPCALYLTDIYFFGPLITGVMAVRFLGLTARHARQDRAAGPALSPAGGVLFPGGSSGTNDGRPLRSTQSCNDVLHSGVTGSTAITVGNSGSDIATVAAVKSLSNNRLDVPTAISHSRPGPWSASVAAAMPAAYVATPRRRFRLEWLDRLLLRYKLHTTQSQLLALGSWMGLWLIYYVLQLATFDPRLRDPAAVGCRYKLVDHVLFVLICAAYIAVLPPLLLRLWGAPDSLGLREELLLQQLYWPPLIFVMLYGKFVPSFEVSTYNGEAAILLGMNVTLLVSVWGPGLASLARATQDAPATPAEQLTLDEGAARRTGTGYASNRRVKWHVAPGAADGYGDKAEPDGAASGSAARAPPDERSPAHASPSASSEERTVNASYHSSPTPIGAAVAMLSSDTTGAVAASGEAGAGVSDSSGAHTDTWASRAMSLPPVEAAAADERRSQVYGLQGGGRRRAPADALQAPGGDAAELLTPVPASGATGVFSPSGRRKSRSSGAGVACVDSRSRGGGGSPPLPLLGRSRDSRASSWVRGLDDASASPPHGPDDDAPAPRATEPASLALRAALAAANSSELLQQPASLSEAVQALGLAPAALLSSPRGLSIAAALLVCTAEGSAALRRVLEREFASELLSFLHAGISLLAAIEAAKVAAGDASAGGGGGSSPPPASIGAVAPRRAAGGHVSRLAAIQALAGELQDRFVRPGSDAEVNLSDACRGALLGAIGGALQALLAELRPAVVPTTEGDAVAGVVVSLPGGLGAAGDEDAVAAEAGAAAAGPLHGAVAGPHSPSPGPLGDLRSPPRRPGAPLLPPLLPAALEMLQAALVGALRDVFRTVVRGSLFRWLQSSAGALLPYRRWAAALLAPQAAPGRASSAGTTGGTGRAAAAASAAAAHRGSGAVSKAYSSQALISSDSHRHWQAKAGAGAATGNEATGEDNAQQPQAVSQ